MKMKGMFMKTKGMQRKHIVLLSLLLALVLFFVIFLISITAEAANYTVTTTNNAGGVSDFGQSGGAWIQSATVTGGTKFDFEVRPDTGYVVASVTINGTDLGTYTGVAVTGAYQHWLVTMPHQNTTIKVVFKNSYDSIVFDNDTDYSLVTAANSMHRITTTGRVNLPDYAGLNDACMQLTTVYSSDTSINKDPYVYIKYDSKTTLYAMNYRYIVITMKTSESYTNGMLYPITSQIAPSGYAAATGFGFGFTLINDGLWHDYVFDMSAFTSGAWQGTIKALRLDYFNAPSSAVPANKKCYVRSVQLFSSISTPGVSASAAYNYGNSISISYTGLGSYLNTDQKQTPFVAVYASGKKPGEESAKQFKIVSTSDGSVTFPSQNQSSSGTTHLAPGNYTAWIAYDGKGSTSSANFNNSLYATVYNNGTSKDISLGNTTSDNFRIDPKITIDNGSGGTATFTNYAGTSYTSGSFFSQYNKAITVSANPNSGYRVKSIKVGSSTWTNTDMTHDKTISKTYTITANTTITVTYVRMYTVTFSQPTGGTIAVTNNSSGATISSGNYVDTGTVIKVTATASTGYTFSSLTVAGSSFSSGSTKTISANTQISASFTANKYAITITPDPSAGGTVTVKNGNTAISSGDKIDYNTTLTVTATANPGYTLKSITAGGTTLSSGGTFKVSGATTVKATFTKNSYTMTITVPDNMTSITAKGNDNVNYSSGDKVPYGTKLTITLTPKSGYRVKTATIGGTTKQTYSTMSTTAVTYTYTVGTAAFTVSGTVGRIYKVTYSDFSNCTIKVVKKGTTTTVASESYVDTGTELTVTLTPGSGYRVKTVTLDGTKKQDFTTMSTTAVTYTYAIANDDVISGTVVRIYKVTYSDFSNCTITVVKKGTTTTVASDSYVDTGTELTVTLTPGSGYRVKTVTLDGTKKKDFTTMSTTAVTYTYAIANDDVISGTVGRIYQVKISNPDNGVITLADPNGNAVAADSYVDVDTVLTVKLDPGDGYRVKTITAGGTSIKENSTISNAVVSQTHKVTGTVTYSGTVGAIYKVTYSNITNGTITVVKKGTTTTVASDSYVDTGTELTVKLDPADGYRVKTITAGGSSIKDNSTISNAVVSADHKVTSDVTFSGTVGAIYKVTIGSLTAEKNETYNGVSMGEITIKNSETQAKVSDGDYVDAGTKLTVTYTPPTGTQKYRLRILYANNENLIYNSAETRGILSKEHTVNADTEYRALCRAMYKVTIKDMPNGTITINVNNRDGNKVINSGDYVDHSVWTLEVTPEANPGYTLNKIYVNGNAITGNTFTVTADSVVTAKFISVFKVEVFTQTIGGAISAESLVNNGGSSAVSKPFSQGTISVTSVGTYGGKVTLGVSGNTLSFLGWYHKSPAAAAYDYDRLISTAKSYTLSDDGLHTDMQIVAVFTATSDTSTQFNFMNVAGQVVQTIVAAKGSYISVDAITATPFKAGSAFTGWEFLKHADKAGYKETKYNNTTYYLVEGTTQTGYKYDYSILYKEKNCVTPMYIYVNGNGGVVNIDASYTKIATENKVVITVVENGTVNGAKTSISVDYNTTVTATATGSGTFVGWIDKNAGTTRKSSEACLISGVYYPYISYEETFSFKALNTMKLQPIYGTSVEAKPNVSITPVLQLVNNKTSSYYRYTVYGMFTPNADYKIVEWGTLFYGVDSTTDKPATVVTDPDTGKTSTVNVLTLESNSANLQKISNVYGDNATPSGQYAASINVRGNKTIYVRMYCTYSYEEDGETKYAVTYSDTYVFSTATYVSSTESGILSGDRFTLYAEPDNNIDNSDIFDLF